LKIVEPTFLHAALTVPVNCGAGIEPPSEWAEGWGDSGKNRCHRRLSTAALRPSVFGVIDHPRIPGGAESFTRLIAVDRGQVPRSG